MNVVKGASGEFCAVLSAFGEALLSIATSAADADHAYDDRFLHGLYPYKAAAAKRVIYTQTSAEARRVGVFPSASPRCLDGGDVDLLHRHHRLEGTLCLTATSRKRIG